MADKVVAGNWKMNKYLAEGSDFFQELVKKDIPEDVKVILGVPYPMLGVSSTLTKNHQISIAAQNCHHKASGAYTGEVSASMIYRTGAEYVIIGHSERREYNAEGNSLIRKKMEAALEARLKVILCCGESLSLRKSGEYKEFVKNQLEKTVLRLSKCHLKNIIIAYEPIWAIGTGETASPEQAQEMHAYIRKQVGKTFTKKIANTIPILYGGSVKPANAEALFSQKDVDGGLVGGASLDPGSFHEIIMSY